MTKKQLKFVLISLSGLAVCTLIFMLIKKNRKMEKSEEIKTGSFEKESRGKRNNNPHNIRISKDKFQGEIVPSKDIAFKQFDEALNGYRATAIILRTYRNKYGLKTIAGIIQRFAPASDGNNTKNYIKQVANAVGINENEEIKTADQYSKALAKMAYIESYYIAGSEEDKIVKNIFNNLI